MLIVDDNYEPTERNGKKVCLKYITFETKINLNLLLKKFNKVNSFKSNYLIISF